MYLYLDQVAQQWAEERGESTDLVLQELLEAFWLGEFEQLGIEGGPGALLGGDNFSTVKHEDRSWIGQPFSREQMLRDVLGTISELPHWGIWETTGKDPGGHQWIEQSIVNSNKAFDGSAYRNLSTCPLDRYPDVAREFVRNLAFPPGVLARWFHRHGRPAPDFVKRALVAAAEADLLGATSAPADEPFHPPRGRVRFSRSGLDDWYQGYVRRCQAEGRIPSREEDWEAARREFHPEMPREPVRDARRRLAPKEWRRQGPRPHPKNSGRN